MGTSMGCLHDVVWMETYPDFARAAYPAREIAGLNRKRQRMTVEATKQPGQRGGDYAAAVRRRLQSHKRGG